MRLHDAARRFHDTQAYDGYTGAKAFLCAFSSFDDHSADGATARRRVLNLMPADTVPTRRVISIYGERWLVGVGAPDSFAGTQIRVNHSMKKATDLAALLTPAQACAAAAGTPAYVQRKYFRDTANGQTDAQIDTFWNVFVAPGEPVQRGTFIRCSGELLRTRGEYLPIEGLLVAQCDTLDPGAVQTLTFVSNGTYNPGTDALTAISTAVGAIAIDMSKLYAYRAESDPKLVAGDLTYLVPKSAITPATGAEFTAASGRWRVLTVQSELDCWLLHCRRA